MALEAVLEHRPPSPRVQQFGQVLPPQRVHQLHWNMSASVQTERARFAIYHSININMHNYEYWETRSTGLYPGAYNHTHTFPVY